MLSIYLMVATVMVLNLLVALFATTYEDVMVSNGVVNDVVFDAAYGIIFVKIYCRKNRVIFGN